MQTDDSPVAVHPPERQLNDPVGGSSTSSAGPARRGRWGHVALIVFTLAVSAALAIAWQRWGQFNPNLSSSGREQAHIVLSPAEHPWYYPMLFGHVLFSSIALFTAIFQVWPWLRRAYPSLHRRVGYVYAFGGVFPAVIFGVVVEIFWPFSTQTAVSQYVQLFLWGAVTVTGVVRRRQGLIAEHRRWMIRSFALTSVVLIELTIDPFIQLIISSQFHSRLMSNMDIYMQMKDSTENWVGLTIVFVVTTLLLERRPQPDPREPGLVRTSPVVAGDATTTVSDR